MANPKATWSRGFLRQAQSDLDVYEMLVTSGAASALPVCHRLHYLQMWLEKLCKAYLWLAATGTADAPELTKRHQLIEKVLPNFIRTYWKSIGYESEPEFRALRGLCREIDLLHPQIDDGGHRPDNVEYPWPTFRDGQAMVVAPKDEMFQVAKRLNNHIGRKMMKAAVVLTRSPLVWSVDSHT